MTDILKIKEWIEEADYIVIGAGAGLSEAAGLHYKGKKFEADFKDYIQKYGMKDLYTSSFYPFQSEEERWAYWAKHIYFSYYERMKNKLYQDIYSLVKEKEYFVITTNCDGQFLNNGFDPDRVFEVQGSYSKLQCEYACHNQLYDAADTVFKMLDKIDNNLKIPTELVPKCPKCKKNMTVNLRCDEYFVEDNHWQSSQDRYSSFLEKALEKKVLLLEFGVGFNTPGIIRFPFEKLTFLNSNTRLIRFNRDYAAVPKEIKDRSIEVSDSIEEIVKLLKDLFIKH